MKVKIVIEETIAQEFEVEITDLENGHEEIRNMYKNEKLVVDEPYLVDALLMIVDEDGQLVEWDGLL